MLYVDALCRGIDPLPTVSEAVRREMYDRLECEGLASLLQELRRLDPVYGAQVDPCNAKRVVHALEIIKESGRPFSELRTGTRKKRPFRVVKIGLTRPREELFDRINRRVTAMVEEGFLDEARRVQGADAQPGRLFVSVCGEKHRARALSELGRCPRSQARQRERGRRLVGVQPLAPQPRSEGEDVV